MKYLILFLPLLVMGCANTVEVEHKVEYKCGEQIIVAEFLDDDSIIARINGTNYVLSEVTSSSGERYENTAAKINLMQNGGDTYLSIDAYNYPLCHEIIR